MKIKTAGVIVELDNQLINLSTNTPEMKIKNLSGEVSEVLCGEDALPSIQIIGRILWEANFKIGCPIEIGIEQNVITIKRKLHVYPRA